MQVDALSKVAALGLPSHAAGVEVVGQMVSRDPAVLTLSADHLMGRFQSLMGCIERCDGLLHRCACMQGLLASKLQQCQ
jgi:hypothetical protein